MTTAVYDELDEKCKLYSSRITSGIIGAAATVLVTPILYRDILPSHRPWLLLGAGFVAGRFAHEAFRGYLKLKQQNAPVCCGALTCTLAKL